MPRINNDNIYDPTSPLSGATWIGSMPDGKSVQFTFDGMIEAVRSLHDLVFFERAVRAGQFVVGNLPDDEGGIVEGSAAPGFNGGMPFLAVLKAYPAAEDNNDNIHYILQQV